MFNPVSISGNLFKKYLTMPSHPAKVRIQNIVGKNFFSGDLHIKNEEGVSFALDPNDWITRVILKDGDYESGSTKLAKNILKAGGFFLDVGANFGLFTCIVASKNADITVIAVEPNYKIIGRLLNNIRINNLGSRVQVINTAVSKKFQLVTLEQPASDNMGTTVTRVGGGALSILSCSLEFICSITEKKPVELLKIDIEGNEFDILENFPFEDFIIKNIILEFNHLSGVSFSHLHAFFSAKGFAFFTIEGKPLNDDKAVIPENNIWIVNNAYRKGIN